MQHEGHDSPINQSCLFSSVAKLAHHMFSNFSCQIMTVQLLNNEPVPCHWSIAEETLKPLKKVQLLQFSVNFHSIFSMLFNVGLCLE